MANFRYGNDRFGTLPYGGLAPAQVIPSRNVSGIIFMVSNDRYQVVTCSYGGTQGTPPEFRYWFAAPPAWPETVNIDLYIPPYHSLDENLDAPVASIEFPFRKLNAPQEMQVTGVIVEFMPRPTAVDEGITGTTPLGFSVHVEGQGVQDYQKAGQTGLATGMAISDTLTFASTVGDQDSDVWPNIRTTMLPCAIKQRLRAARVVISDLTLCEIVSVQLLGDTGIPGRN